MSEGKNIIEQEEQQIPLEELFEELEAVVKRLEGEDVALEDAFRLYNDGMNLLKRCNDTIDTVEKKVLVLDEEGGTHEF